MTQDIGYELLSVLKCVLGNHNGPVQLSAPSLPLKTGALLQECIDANWVSSAGAFVARFEEQLSALTGLHAVATVNGTAALHVALHLAGAKHGDEVLAPSLAFVAIANAITYCGASPHFVDVESQTLGVCPDSLAAYLSTIVTSSPDGPRNKSTGRRIAALCVVLQDFTPAPLKPAKTAKEETKPPFPFSSAARRACVNFALFA